MGDPKSVARMRILTADPGCTALMLVTAHPPAERSNIVPSLIDVLPLVEK
jgi:hypothetical protein